VADWFFIFLYFFIQIITKTIILKLKSITFHILKLRTQFACIKKV